MTEIATDLHEQALYKALSVLVEVMDDDDNYGNTEQRIEACRIVLQYDSDMYAAQLEYSSTEDKDEEEEDG